MTPPPTTVVLVDDAPEVRGLVRLHLRLSRRFAVVGEGASGTDAVALAEQHRPDLMLLDVSMPIMDGLQALPLVRAASPGTQVVLFSGFDERGLAARGRELGALGFIEKSVSVDRLADDLIRLLDAVPADTGAPEAADQGADGASPGPATTSATTATTPASTEDDDRSRAPGGPADRTGAHAPASPANVLGEDLERFREVFEEAAIGMATMTLTGHVVRANRALAAVVGRGVDDLVGVAYSDIATEGDADAIRSVVLDLNDGRTDVARVEHGLAADRSRSRHISATVATVRGHHGRPLYLFLQAQDVSEQRHADELLRQSEERFRMLVEAVEDYAIFMLDPHGLVASWNAGAQRIKGYTADEIIGQHFRRFYPAEQQAVGHPELELRLALRDGHYEEEGWRVRKDGRTFWANVVITAVRNASGHHVGFAKVTRDITERRNATQQRDDAALALARAKEDLEAMNARLLRAAADQSQFLAVTAHELRTPVAVLGGSATTLAQHWRELEDDERTDLFEGMVAGAARLRRLLADLLTAARLEAGAVDLELQPVAVADLLAGAAADARQGRSADDVVVHADPDLLALADRDRAAQAVDNLIGNALRHGEAPVLVSAGAADGWVTIRVSDSGPGVPDSVRPQLFERFVTGARRGGTGLGLFIVRELARAQGGDAWYEDTRPTTFALTLPHARVTDRPG